MGTVQSVERCFAILRVVAAEPCGLSEIGRRVGLPKSTVARLTATLEAEGAVARRGDVYGLGPGVAELAASVGGVQNMIVSARPHLRRVVSITNESAGMGVREGDMVRYVVQLDSARPVQVRDWTGTVAPLHACASGLAMLAHMEEAQFEDYLAGELVRTTPYTMAEPAALRARLDAIRGRGFVSTEEEFIEGINSVGAAVCHPSGAVAGAIDIWGPAFRFPGTLDEDELGRLAVETANAIALSLD